jgi:predicted amidohydrolase
VVNRCRAIENMAYVVAANQGASLAHYGPFSWPGGSMVVDFDGRLLAQSDPGPGEKIVVAEIDLGALREARQKRLGHNPLPHLRREAYPNAPCGYPATGPDPGAERSVEGNNMVIKRAIHSWSGPWGYPA